MKKHTRMSVVSVVAISMLTLVSTVSAQSAAISPVICPITRGEYMKIGITNDLGAVTRLQLFMKNMENGDVDVNGLFDAKTDAAVKIFQKKYASDILEPWNASEPSGIVYLTTGKKINQIGCNTAITMDDRELTIIRNYVARKTSALVPDQNKAAVGITASSANENVIVEAVPTEYAVSVNQGSATMVRRFRSYIDDLFR